MKINEKIFSYLTLNFYLRKLAARQSNSNNDGPTGNDGDAANRVTYDEFAILVRRIDRMEYSIGNIVSRVTFFFCPFCEKQNKNIVLFSLKIDLDRWRFE